VQEAAEEGRGVIGGTLDGFVVIGGNGRPGDAERCIRGGGVRVRDGDHELDADQYDIGHDERNPNTDRHADDYRWCRSRAGVGVGSGADEASARRATRVAVPTTSRRATTQAAAPKPAAPKTTAKKSTEKELRRGPGRGEGAHPARPARVRVAPRRRGC
jgi:hypothetical protein